MAAENDKPAGAAGQPPCPVCGGAGTVKAGGRVRRCPACDGSKVKTTVRTK